MKNILFTHYCLSLILMPLFAKPQQKGIEFMTALSWRDIQERAKTKNKFVFVDCYASWCGPCKQMDLEVYSKDNVGQFFNDRFLSVRVQMDQTKIDDAETKAWYADAILLQKQFKIMAYPTLLILSSDGTILDKEIGFMSADSLVTMAKKAIMGKAAYRDPYAGYEGLVKKFRDGEIEYSSLPVLIKLAQQLNDTAVMFPAAKTYKQYLLNLSNDSFYTRENIGFIVSTYAIPIKSPLGEIFYKNAARIDKVMAERGFAERVIDRAIQYEYVLSVTKVATEDYVIARARDTVGVKEPDWNRLSDTIRAKFGEKCAKRNILAAKVAWLQYHKKYGEWSVLLNEKIKKYGADTTFPDDMNGNGNGWDFCLYVTDKRQLRRAIYWMKGVAERAGYRNRYWEYATADT